MKKGIIPSFGPAGYEAVVNHLAGILAGEKSDYNSDRVMTVGIEGPSNSGKTTLSQRLQESLHEKSLGCIAIEGDRFQAIKLESMKVYETTLAALDNGEAVPGDFPERIWRYEVMRAQLFEGINAFNCSPEQRGQLRLTGVISGNKMNYLDEPMEYDLTKKSVVLVPGMYLRHLPVFDLLFELSVDPEISVARKIERDKERKYPRPPGLTRRMVVDIEHHLTQERRENFPIKRGAIVDTNNFDSLTVEGI